MKLIILALVTVVLLSLPALGQKHKAAPKKAAAPVVAAVVATEPVVPVKKRTPMMSEDGSGAVYEDDKEVADEERYVPKGAESAHQTEGQRAEYRKSGKSGGRSVVDRPVLHAPRVDRPQVVAPRVSRPQVVAPRVNRPSGGRH